MRVRMRTTMAGPQGSAKAGDVVDIDPAVAKVWVDQRYADAVDPPPSPPRVFAAEVAVAETALAEPQRSRRVAPK